MNRRTCLALGVAAAAQSIGFAGADFWTAKEPSEWDEKDLERLLHRSPWSKEVTVQIQMNLMEEGGGGDVSGGRRGRTGGGGGGGMPDASSDAGMGGGGGGGRGGGRGGAGGMDAAAQARPEMKAVVRWESARPIRDAAKKEFPKELAAAYVISVTGLRMGAGGRRGAAPGQEQAPAEGDRGAQMNERLKAGAQLERKGADPISPAQVQTGRIPAGPVSYFIFPRGSQPIQASEKEVTFHLKLDRMELKAKFVLKDMMYKGELAV
jgi:hypothetical protein